MGSFDGVRDFNADLWKNIETTSVCSIESSVVVFFIWGRGEEFFGRGQF